jgi:hypothetical protein
MRFACWITKATDTHTEYVILIALPRQQWLRERATMLRYIYIACFSMTLVLIMYVVSDIFMVTTICDNAVVISSLFMQNVLLQPENYRTISIYPFKDES